MPSALGLRLEVSGGHMAFKNCAEYQDFKMAHEPVGEYTRQEAEAELRRRGYRHSGFGWWRGAYTISTMQLCAELGIMIQESN